MKVSNLLAISLIVTAIQPSFASDALTIDVGTFKKASVANVKCTIDYFAGNERVTKIMKLNLPVGLSACYLTDDDHLLSSSTKFYRATGSYAGMHTAFCDSLRVKKDKEFLICAKMKPRPAKDGEPADVLQFSQELSVEITNVDSGARPVFQTIRLADDSGSVYESSFNMDKITYRVSCSRIKNRFISLESLHDSSKSALPEKRCNDGPALWP